MNRSVTTIFSDDVRQEVNNKQSIIGIYTGQLFVPSLPVTLPKFCIIVRAFTEQNNPFKKLKVIIAKNGAHIIEQELDAEELDILPLSNFGMESKGYHPQVFQLIFVLSPFHIEEPADIQVYLHADGEVYQAPSLLIEKAPEGLQII